MKALHQFFQLSLIVVISLTTMGFRVNLEECHGHEAKYISFFGGPDCCCDKGDKSKPKENTCGDLTCVVQAQYQSQTNHNTSTDQADKAVKAKTAHLIYTQIIRPVLQEQIPHFTLPPPRSGRSIGILHQTFII
ncbi:hypothetical protein AAE02nite_26620 [Adhaeribacter aerolatus]|uniref:Uncharacterized protein n=1 Tax=Adhaeribacter aerolatus TaxID=670289 RepID=A0A512AZ50_9BACT|nr:hypothetical protein [Adhaeribacter aerolatus]GEO04998.1 hypothetical protein AAE02nite_26620 [Adhaeribacter aerolatus]